MICKFCGQDKKLGKSHIIPQAFFIDKNAPSTRNKLITNQPNTPPKRLPIGVYDENILCLECEKKFGLYDNYAISLFKNTIGDEHKRYLDKELYIYEIDPDYMLLKLFFLSLLWRSHVSTHEFYQNVNIDSHAETIKTMLINNNPGDMHNYPVLCSKFDIEPHLVGLIGPMIRYIEGVKCYVFVFYGIEVTIKVDKAPLHLDLHHLILAPERKFYITSQKYENSNYWKLLLETTKNQKYKIY